MELQLKSTVNDMQEYDVILDKKVIGQAVLRILNNQDNDTFGNIAYAINKEFRGNHYGVEVVRLLVDEAISMGMPYLISCVNDFNLASKRTMELSGWNLISKFKIRDYLFLKYQKTL